MAPAVIIECPGDTAGTRLIFGRSQRDRAGVAALQVEHLEIPLCGTAAYWWLANYAMIIAGGLPR